MATRKPTFEDLPPEVERNEENLESWNALDDFDQRRVANRAKEIIDEYGINTVYLIASALYAGA